MPEEPINPFGPQPQQLPAQQPPQLGGLASLTPQEGQLEPEGGSFYAVSPEVLEMMWAPKPQQLVPQQLPEQLPPQAQQLPY
jgi:hypothetical protein